MDGWTPERQLRASAMSCICAGGDVDASTLPEAVTLARWMADAIISEIRISDTGLRSAAMRTAAVVLPGVVSGTIGNVRDRRLASRVAAAAAAIAEALVLAEQDAAPAATSAFAGVPRHAPA